MSNTRHKNAVHILMLYVNIQARQGENRKHRVRLYKFCENGDFFIIFRKFVFDELSLMEFAVCPWWKTSLSALCSHFL